MAPDQPLNEHAPARERPRIETQIHRRKKAKAFSSLEPEWDQQDHVLPSHLRMPADRMAPTPPNPAKKPQ
ncbi:MAG: hypothetical protein NTX84_03975 [Nitrospirae bacterium]|nr:hypothetical protein [Nitrospirota bacterium]